MTAFLRKMLPGVSSVPRDVVDDDDDDVEYSFAMEYKGPPVTYTIPQVLPVDIDYIPTASVVYSASSLNNLSFPVIQPIEKRDRLKKFADDSKFGPKDDVSLCQVTDSNGSVKEGGERVLSCESMDYDTAVDLNVLSSESVDHGTEDGLNVLSSESEDYGTGEGLNVNSNESVDTGMVEGLNVGVIPRGSSVVNEPSVGLGLIGDDEVKPLSDGMGSSGSLEYVASFHDSHESSGRPNASSLLDNDKEGVEVQGCTNSAEDICNSAELYTSSRSFSSENSICMEICENETPLSVKQLSAVRFRDPESSYIINEESDQDDADIIQVRHEPAARIGKKGSCYRCGKGNRFTEKEGCLVCGAKYCGNCVLRAMGSMPEGRKCIPCTGQPINESNRANLGKSSRMLKRLLSEMETKQRMRLELLCKANQLQPEVIFVNKKPLCQEEIVLLQSCSNPPKKLKPGYYWYDKVSGFWGKEGQKPCQIISPSLTIGFPIKRDASNGNTNVLINDREITKVELLMLQFAGVECEGSPTFWMYADGLIKEVGMNREKCRLWDKTGMRLFCVLLSLPIPSEVVNTDEEDAANLVNRGVLNHPDDVYLHKLLLVGLSKSGTSTIFKQAKLLYNVPFTEGERQNIKFIIQSNLYKYLCILLEGRQRFEEEILIKPRNRQTIDQSNSSENIDKKNENDSIYSVSPRLKEFSDWLLQIKRAGNLESIFPAATREYAPIVEDLWKNDAIQATYDRINELKMLPRVASYFLNRAVEISRTEYEPSDTDILFAEGITLLNGPASVEFSFPKSVHDSCMQPAYHHDPSLRYELIRVHLRNLGGNYKWLNMFEDVGIVLFCVNLTDYDQFSDHGNGSLTNDMIETKKLFEGMVTHPIFHKKNFLLILNKFDLFEEKIKQVPLNRCEWLNEFKPVISHHSNSGNNNNNIISSTNPSLAQRAFQYIAVKFKSLYKSLTGPESEHKLYVSLATALEPDTVDKALRYAREILKWNEEKENFISSDDVTSYSVDASSSQFSQ